MTEEKKPREDVFGRPLKHQTYELLVESVESLRDLSKEFKLTAGEVMEMLLKTADMEKVAAEMTGLRQRKEAARAWALEKKHATGAGKTTKTSIAKQLKDLSPDKLAQIQALISAS